MQTIYGGRAFEPQVESLRRGVEIVVGTPGRLLDLARQGHLNLGQVEVLVLDEADEMLDLGFLPDVERILEQTPTERQTMLFSATMPGPVVTMARRFMRQPTHIRAEEANENRTVPDTQIFVYRAHAMDKGEVLARILQAEGRGLTMVFCRTKRTCDKVAEDMVERGFAAAAVHGDLGQGAREQALRAFRSGKIDVLVATDVAARGIDVQDVTHVINYQCPDDERTFLHRIGRTGRAGAKGVAVTFVDWDDIPKWGLINKALDLPFAEVPETYSSSPHLYSRPGHPGRHHRPAAARRPGSARAWTPRRSRTSARPVAAPRRRPAPAVATAAGTAVAAAGTAGDASAATRPRRPPATTRRSCPSAAADRAAVRAGPAWPPARRSRARRAGRDGDAPRPPRAARPRRRRGGRGRGKGADAAGVERPRAGRGRRRRGRDRLRAAGVHLLLLADTHVPKRARDLPAAGLGRGRRAPTWSCTPATGSTWRCSTRSRPRAARLLACWGNNDGPDLRARLPEVARAELEGVRVAVVHETGPAAGREARAAAAHPDTDLLVFGHSHIPWDSVAPGGLRLLNPGSPTDRRRQPAATYLTVRLEAGGVHDVQQHALPGRSRA